MKPPSGGNSFHAIKMMAHKRSRMSSKSDSDKPTYDDFKLNSSQEQYLFGCAVRALRNQQKENITQAWFDAFLEHIEQIGYRIVRRDDI